MINKRILIISNFPVENAIHGGQKRAKAFYEYYKSIFKETKFISVFYEGSYRDFSDNDLPIKSEEIIKKIKSIPPAADIYCSEAMYMDTVVKKDLLDKINSYKPDIIQFEQVYPFIGLEVILKELPFQPKLVLNSYNNEAKMKKEIFQRLNILENEKKEILRQIKNAEIKASKKSDLVIAVSQEDAKYHSLYGSKNCTVVKNGIEKITPTTAAIKHWQDFKKNHLVKKLVTFVGSAHPPNYYGFDQMVGKDTGFLDKDTVLMLAGGVSYNLQEHYEFNQNNKSGFWEKAHPLGELSDDNLAGLITVSDILILPITEGGGSNLKTAEALLANKKIVATDFAFRSFDEYRTLPNIYIANTKKDFKEQIIKALNSKRVERSRREQYLVNEVRWGSILRKINRPLEKMIYGRKYFFHLLLRRVKHHLGIFKSLVSSLIKKKV